MKRTQHHLLLCADCTRATLRLPRNAGRALIWTYRHTLSPLVGFNCRHLPSCSVYADEAVERFGLWGGGWMTLARLLRCQPWGTSGIDNVPAAKPPNAAWYRPWRYGRWRGVNAPERKAPENANPLAGGLNSFRVRRLWHKTRSRRGLRRGLSDAAQPA
jgi:putative membrane protein insertion efficiency factor